MSKVYNIRDISSIRDMVETSCELFADNPAFLSRDGETVYVKTYTEVGEDIRALAAELTARGMRGEKIAVMGVNCYQWALTYLAVCSGVGIIVPVDREYNGEQLSYVMEDSGAAMLIHGDGVSIPQDSPYRRSNFRSLKSLSPPERKGSPREIHRTMIISSTPLISACCSIPRALWVHQRE